MYNPPSMYRVGEFNILHRFRLHKIYGRIYLINSTVQCAVRSCLSLFPTLPSLLLVTKFEVTQIAPGTCPAR